MAKKKSTEDAKEVKTQEIKRFYKDQTQVDSDLFKLQVAPMRKNIHWDKTNPRYELFEHCHVYRTVDSSGKVLETSAETGGHFHKLEVKVGEDGKLTAKCSPPLKWVRNKKGRSKERHAVPLTLNGDNFDTHTHEVKYIKSEKIKLRESNEEFAKFDAAVKSKAPTPVAGVL